MKPYPFNEMDIQVGGFAGDSGQTKKVTIPTAQAIQNFEDYLEESEWVFYHQLSDDTKIHLALSVNPFNAFMDIYRSSH